MKKYIILSWLAFALVSSSCNDTTNIEQWYVYHETLCTDAWQTGPAHSEMEATNAMAQYLDNQGINILDTGFESDNLSFIYCQACDCLSGRLLKVKIDTSDEAVLTAEGFVEE